MSRINLYFDALVEAEVNVMASYLLADPTKTTQRVATLVAGIKVSLRKAVEEEDMRVVDDNGSRLCYNSINFITIAVRDKLRAYQDRRLAFLDDSELRKNSEKSGLVFEGEVVEIQENYLIVYVEGVDSFNVRIRGKDLRIKVGEMVKFKTADAQLFNTPRGIFVGIVKGE